LLCSSMTADDVKATLDLTIHNTGMKAPEIIRPRLLSDNGPCYILKELAEYLEDQKMKNSRGRLFHPQIQGKIERYHCLMKNIILLDNCYLPQELETRISEWFDYYNNHRYHESLGNITPSEKYKELENNKYKE